MPQDTHWTPHPDALALLELNGGPFERSSFRNAYVTATPGCRDISFGAIGRDGTLAAIALVARGRLADSMPPSGYGGIHSSRRLSLAEVSTFFSAARRSAHATSLVARALVLDRPPVGGRAFTTASVVDVAHAPDYSRLARRSLRRAELAGATVARSQDAAPFFDLYRIASAQWAARYPEALIEQLAADGVGVFHHVEVAGEVISSLFTLTDGAHWMCWLAAQSEQGRGIAASYLAYDALFEEAGATVDIVNLGASAPGSGGMQFKTYLGAFDAPMVAWRAAAPGWSAARAVVAQASSIGARIRGRPARFS